MKSRDLQPRLLYPAKLSFRIGGQIKCFPDKKKLKELIITKPLYFLNFIYLFLERGEGKEKDRERNISVGETHGSVASHTLPTGELAHNPGMCPNWESNWRPFISQASTHSTESPQPGPKPLSYEMLKGVI